ncbi:MAG: VWA domain-containing protein [Bryobacteraceae bacterium]|jgi:VWFA-related protein
MSIHCTGPQRRLAILLVLSAGAFGQAPEQNRFQTSVREVVVDVVVHDSHGKLVKKLNSKDVALYEDGVRREIRSWRLVSGQEVRRGEAAQAEAAGGKGPRPAAASAPSLVQTINLISLIFHDIGPETRRQAFQAAHDFLDNELRPNTIIGVFSLDDRGVHPTARFTTNRAALLQAIQQASAGHTPSLSSSRELFSALGLERNLAIQPPPLPAQAGASPPNTTIVLNSPDLAIAGASLDSSSAVGDEASAVGLNPLGRNGIHEARVVATRELHAFNWLVDQLRQMPFRKTVVLFSPGITRPPDQIDFWKAMLAKANAAGINFYALEVNGVSQASPMLGAIAGLQRTAQLSASQGKPARDLGEMADRSEQSNISENAIVTANTHATLVDLTEETGGFLITDSSKRMLTRIMNDAETRYELTYSPAWETYDGRFHKIEVKPAREGLTVEARSGYYAVPARADGSPLTPEEMAGLRALNTTPLPHEFDYRAQALHFRAPDGPSELVLAFEIPIASLAATPEPAEKKHRLHASLLALVKDSSGQIVQQVSADSPLEMPDWEPRSARTGRLTFDRSVALPAGHYTVQTAVVDWESGRVSANTAEIDCASQKGPELSSIALVRRVEDVKGPAGANPMEYQGKHIVPALFTTLDGGANPSLFFRVYPDRSSTGKVRLRAQFLLDGRLLADQDSDLPAPDDSGSIPVLIQLPARTGGNELKLTVLQGGASSGQNIQYTIAAQ